MGEEVKITYETLFDLLRREKNRDDLQKLEPSFYVDVLDYLREKKAAAAANGHGHFDSEKSGIQLQNIKRIVRGIYEKRERKIVQMAINKVRIGADVIDKTVFLENERALFEELTALLSRYRDDVVYRVLGLEQPDMRPCAPDTATAAKKPDAVAPAEMVRLDVKESADEEARLEPETHPKKEEAKENFASVRFLDKIPKFVGKQLEVYGPFERNDEALLPETIALILVNKGKAERVRL